MTRRILRTEFIRGVAPVALVVTLGLMLYLLFFRTSFVRPWPWVWVGRWGSLANSVRSVLQILLPVVITAAAWQGGRDVRRRTDELVQATPRPRWHGVLASWGTLTLSVVAAMVVALAVCVFFVIPHATMAGDGWWETLLVGMLAVVSMIALGFSAGALVRSRFVAPILGVALLIWLDSAGPAGKPRRWLSPGFVEGDRIELHRFEPSLLLQQTLLFGGLGVVALVLVAARRARWLAVVPLVVASLGLGLIVSGGGAERFVPIEGAADLVCADADERGVEVCWTRVNSFVLDDVVELVDAQLARWDGVDGFSVRRVVDGRAFPADGIPPGDSGEVWLDLQEENFGWDGRLRSWGATTLEELVARAVIGVSAACRAMDDSLYSDDAEVEFGEQVVDEALLASLSSSWEAREIAVGWALEDPREWTYDSVLDERVATENPRIVRLLALPEAEQREWMSGFLAAHPTCDTDAMGVLVEDLR